MTSMVYAHKIVDLHQQSGKRVEEYKNATAN